MINQTQPTQTLEDQVKIEEPIQQETKTSKAFWRKKYIFLIGSLFVVVISVVLVFSIYRAGTNPASKDVLPTPSATDKSNIRNKLVLSTKYLASQKKADGTYTYYSSFEDLCTKSNEKCPFETTQSQKDLSVAWTALAYYSDYKVNNTISEFNTAKDELKRLIRNCSTQKNNCLWVLVHPEIIYKETKDAQLLQFITEETNILLKTLPSPNLMLQGIEVRELALAYEITGQSKYLIASKERLAYAQKSLTNQINRDLSPVKKFQPETCWITLAQAELGRVQKNNQDVVNAAVYLDQQKLLENPDKIFTPIVFQPCIETYFTIASSLDDVSYREYASKLLAIFLTNYFDSPTNKILNGKGGTAAFPHVDTPSTIQNYASISDTSYTSYLLFLDFAK